MTEFFNEVAGTWKNYAIENVAFFLAMGAAVGFGGVLAHWRARKAILTGEFGKAAAILGETRYAPTGKINPATGKEFFEQQIRNYQSNLNLENIFHPLARKSIMRYINAASKHCTPDQPVVFQHLDKVVPAEELEKVRATISKDWINYFSEILNQKAHPEAAHLGPRDIAVEACKIPVLVYEPGANKKQYRILLIPLEMLEGDVLPAPEDTLISAEHHSRRLFTNLQVVKALKSEKPGGILDRCRVFYATGEIRSVPLPGSTPISVPAKTKPGLTAASAHVPLDSTPKPGAFSHLLH